MTADAQSRSLRCGDRVLHFGRIPLVMGILNVTPDSFSDGGRFIEVPVAVAHARRMATEGAAIIDIGGESTRPGAHPVSPGEETDRVLPVIERLIQGDNDGAPLEIPISIDTTRPSVAHAALAAGASVVNEVSAAGDAEMVNALRDAGDSVGVVLMHMKGTPQTMQTAPWYDDVVTEVAGYLADRADALVAGGIARSRIVIDPGIGFGKRLADNLDLLKNIDALRALGYPVLIGASRKSFIGRITGRDTDTRLPGSLAVAARCLAGGAEMIRVHDVAETVDALRVLDAIHHPDPWREHG